MEALERPGCARCLGTCRCHTGESGLCQVFPGIQLRWTDSREPQGPDGLGGLSGGVGTLMVVDAEIPALAGQLQGHGPADAPAGTGNERGSLHDLDLLMGDFQRTFPSIANFLKKRKKTVDKLPPFVYLIHVRFGRLAQLARAPA